MKANLLDNPLFLRVGVAEYNRRQERNGSPDRVVDRNGNGVVDEADDFGGADPSYRLHQMCMERRPYEVLETADRLRLSWWDGTLGTPFMAVEMDERAERVMRRHRDRGPDLFRFGNTPDLGLHLFMGTGDHGAWVASLREGKTSLLGASFGERRAILVEGGFDTEKDGCNFNTILKIEGGRGLFGRNRLKITYQNATGRHTEIWNLRTGRIRVRDDAD